MAAASIFALFFLSTITLSLASVNIDCGASTSGVDNENIEWVGDRDFITSGESSTVLSTDYSLTTLRYFPTGDSNCYSNIKVTKGGKVLVRTMFYYGNYDEKSTSPTFNVLYDGKHQETVSIPITSAFEAYISEVIFIPVSGEISVCFVRTSSSSDPFVSSIEVVDMAPGMYDELSPGEALSYQGRKAFGTTGFLRSDLYGRFWVSSGPSTEYTVTMSSATSIDTSDASNKPPETVLQNSWSGDRLILQDPSLPSNGVPVYLPMYFSDPIDTSSSRSFDIFFGGKQVNKSPVVPMFGNTIQVVVRDVVASSATRLEFRSTANSRSPPLINALELYVISKGMSTGSGGSGGSGGGGGSGTGRSDEVNVSSGGSTKEEKNNKLPTILGAIAGVAFVLIAYVFLGIILAKRRRVRLQALAMPVASAAANVETGESPLFGQEMDGHDSYQSANEASMGELA